MGRMAPHSWTSYTNHQDSEVMLAATHRAPSAPTSKCQLGLPLSCLTGLNCDPLGDAALNCSPAGEFLIRRTPKILD